MTCNKRNHINNWDSLESLPSCGQGGREPGWGLAVKINKAPGARWGEARPPEGPAVGPLPGDSRWPGTWSLRAQAEPGWTGAPGGGFGLPSWSRSQSHIRGGTPRASLVWVGTCPSPVPVMGGQGCLDGRPAGTTEFPRPGDSPSIFNILIVVKSSSRKSYHLTIVKWTFLWH